MHSNDDHDLSYQIWKKKQVIYKDLDLHIVTPSHWLSECAKQSSLLNRFPVTVIPNCLDVNVFRPLDETEISPRWLELIRIKSTKTLILFGAVNAANDKVKGFSADHGLDIGTSQVDADHEHGKRRVYRGDCI